MKSPLSGFIDLFRYFNVGMKLSFKAVGLLDFSLIWLFFSSNFLATKLVLKLKTNSVNIFKTGLKILKLA